MLKTEYKFGEVYSLANQIEAADDKVQFNSIFSNENGGVALIAFKEGQVLDPHTAPAEVMVNVIDGEIEFKMFDKANILKAGEFLLMGEGVIHSVIAKTDAKVMLVKIRP